MHWYETLKVIKSLSLAARKLTPNIVPVTRHQNPNGNNSFEYIFSPVSGPILYEQI